MFVAGAPNLWMASLGQAQSTLCLPWSYMVKTPRTRCLLAVNGNGGTVFSTTTCARHVDQPAGVLPSGVVILY